MSESELIRCPDCGGIVGATEPSDEGPPCTCFGAPGWRNTPSPETSANDSSGTSVLDSPATPEKICCMCGKDLAGQKRLKDSRGYWCPECHAEDRQREAQGVKCERCFRIVPAESLTEIDGQRICSRCFREERAIRAPGSKRYRAVSDKTYKEHEKRNMIIMAVILVILLVLMVIAYQRFPSLSMDARPGVDAVDTAQAVRWDAADRFLPTDRVARPSIGA